MKILHVMPYCPVPAAFGGALRIYHLLRYLVDRHDVSVISYGTEEDLRRMHERFQGKVRNIHMIPSPWTTRFRRLGQLYALGTSRSFLQLLAYRRTMQQLVDRVAGDGCFDVVQTEFPMMASFTRSVDAVKILDAHNVEYENFRKMWVNARSPIRKFHYYREYRTMYDEEIAACRSHDAVFVTSSCDREIFDSDVPEIPKYVIPNGVDCSYFFPSGRQPERNALVFTGMMAYVPNYDGMIHFLDHSFPLIRRHVPDVKIYIVGNRPPLELRRRASGSVIITGYVDDVRPYIERASVYVVPLRMGSGTRLKVLEAMAMKKPIVTTSIGCEGIDVRHGESVFIEDDPHAFAGRVVEILKDPERARVPVERGYELVRLRYEWSAIGNSVGEAYQRIFESGRRGSRQRSVHGRSPVVTSANPDDAVIGKEPIYVS